MIKNRLTNLGLIAFILCFSIGAHAQDIEKYIDLEILQLKYAPNEVIPQGEQYLIEVSMINHGPDELLEGDYVLILESISSFPLYYPYGLAVGDIVIIPVFSFINSSEEDEVYEACVWIQFYEEYHENNFILIDSNQTNDTVCFSVIMEGENTNSIKENNASAAFIIYPNPIKAQQSLFVRPQDDQGAMPKYVRIINVLGQEVFQSTMKNGGGMLTIDLPVLNVGIYSLELIDDKGKILHRQSIQIE